jgi:hypothetical protein
MIAALLRRRPRRNESSGGQSRRGCPVRDIAVAATGLGRACRTDRDRGGPDESAGPVSTNPSSSKDYLAAEPLGARFGADGHDHRARLKGPGLAGGARPQW